MKENNDININLTGRSIAKNTIYNLLGNGIPILLAIILIPLLIKGLGNERFGILSLAWIVVGYFSFFDFGIGRALTKIVAEKISRKQTDEIPDIFWTSFLLMLAISILGTIIFIFLIPALVGRFLNISTELQPESLKAFYVLALSVPVVTTTAGIRGVLEAYHEFGILNVIKTFLGISSFMVPLICLIFTNSLFWIVIFLVLARTVVWVLFLLECFRVNSRLRQKVSFQMALVKPIFRLSGWMTVSNIISPIIVYSDRFFIGAIVSATAIAYYSTPYEIVSKLLIVPVALTGVLFPTFSASYINNPDYANRLSDKAIKYIFIILYPVILLIMTFAHEGMQLWLGKGFADNSSLILQFLAAGVLFNSIAFVPFTYLHGIGKPDLTAKIHMAEFPLYLLGMWLTLKFWGIDGAAFFFTLRTIIEVFVLSYAAKKAAQSRSVWGFKLFLPLFFVLVLLFTFILSNLFLKVVFAAVMLLIFIFFVWRYFLQTEEKEFLFSKLKAAGI